MDDLILISTLNDFIFCPYSIYLHNIYMDTDEELYHASPQTKGRIAHESIDTKKDVEYRGIYVINCLEERELRVSSGELLLEDLQEKRILTKLPFQKILALFVVGHIRITTPLIEKCKKNNVALIVVKPSLRPVFYWADSAEANFLVRKKQYAFDKDDISIY